MPEQKPYKGKEYFSGGVQQGGYENLGDNSKMFVDKLVQKFGRDELIFTSGYRKGSGKSHHHKGDALDMRPNPKVWNYLVNDPEGLKLMSDHGFNILDESDPRFLAKTGGSGPHFHIGKDMSGSVVKTTDRYKKYSEIKEGQVIEPIKPFVQHYVEKTGVPFKYTNPVVYNSQIASTVASENSLYSSSGIKGTTVTQQSHYSGDGHDHSHEEEEEPVVMEPNEEDLAMKQKLLEEAEVLKEEQERTEAEKELEAEETAYLEQQKEIMQRKTDYIQGEMQRAENRQEDITPKIVQPQQKGPAPGGEILSQEVNLPSFVYSIGQNQPDIS